MIITISGLAGSGKSTLARLLTHKLKAKRIYVGGIRRALAKKKKMTLEKLNEYALIHPETDVDVDERAAAQARKFEKSGKIVVVDGRIQWHFLPESLKIFMSVELDEAAKRIWKELQETRSAFRKNEGKITSLAAVKKEIKARDENDARRYKKYYGVDHRDVLQYDLVIDTTGVEKKEVVEKILAYLQQKTL